MQTKVSWCLAQNPQFFLLWMKFLCEREASQTVEVAQCAGSICGDTGKSYVAEAGGMRHSPRVEAASQVLPTPPLAAVLFLGQVPQVAEWP